LHVIGFADVNVETVLCESDKWEKESDDNSCGELHVVSVFVVGVVTGLLMIFMCGYVLCECDVDEGRDQK
jgi:hypothetical protein